MRRYTLEIGGKPFVVDVQEVTADRYTVLVGDQAYEVRLSSDEDLAEASITPEIVPIRGNHGPNVAPMVRPAAPHGAEPVMAPPPTVSSDGQTVGALTAPMPGKILSVEVSRGDRVARGQTLLTLEAMKMKNAIKSPYDGVVMEIMVRPEQTVGYGQLLIQLGEE
jgi:biotin carboxyl carrier protein